MGDGFVNNTKETSGAGIQPDNAPTVNSEVQSGSTPTVNSEVQSGNTPTVSVEIQPDSTSTINAEAAPMASAEFSGGNVGRLSTGLSGGNMSSSPTGLSEGNTATSRPSADLPRETPTTKPKRGRPARNAARIDPDGSVQKSDRATPPDDEEAQLRMELIAHGFEDDEWIAKILPDPRDLPLSIKQICFCECDAKGRPTKINDMRIYKYLTRTHHIITCGKLAYVYKDGYYQDDYDETMLCSLISGCIIEQFNTSNIVSRIHRKFLQEHELVKRPEELNHYSPWFINFRNGMYNAKTRRMYPHSYKTYSINQIPWEYDPNGDHGSGETIESFLDFAIPNADDREMLLQYIGLCMTKDVSQQKMLVIQGEGGTGKSTLINLIQDIVGKRNISNVSLNELSQRFKPILLMGKLMNSCADLEIDALDDVSMVKKLIGDDDVDGEHKGLKPISFRNYAKLIFSTNELPMVRNEKTNGFYRRLLILKMDNEPDRQDPNLKTKLQNEIPYLIHLAMQALQRMYANGHITNSDSSKQLTKQLRMESDTVEAFLNDMCDVTRKDEDRISKGVLYDEYKKYCDENERQAHTRNNLYKAMKNKRFTEVKGKNDRMFAGLKLKDDFMEVPDGTNPDEIFGE